ncbi:hypothetical protein R1flu_007335 [Riccia fluitans]|uniref:Uncharacterized protein n=1 Tax=Riccia fluitans TaxID=41844 RepID=A0ABD1YZ50_9MARC
MLNSVLVPVRPEHFQHNQLALYHYAWVAIKDPTAPTLDWGDAMEKIETRKVKALGVCNEATCLGLYLAHLYRHFHEMDNEQKEEFEKQKALEQLGSDSKTKTEEEKETKRESPSAAWIEEASGSKPLDTKKPGNFNEWGVLQNLGRKTSKFFEALHVNVTSITAEEVARNMEKIFCTTTNCGGHGYSTMERDGEKPGQFAHDGVKEEPGSGRTAQIF